MTAGERIRGQLLRRTPTSVLLLLGLAIGGARIARWLTTHPGTVAGAATAAGLWWLIDTGRWWWLLTAAGAALLTLGAIMELRPTWWQRLTATLASRRRLRWYTRRWDLAIRGANLDGVDETPSLLSHRFGGLPHERDLDVLTVRMAAGQLVGDWRDAQVRLAGTFELQRLRCHPIPGCPRDVQLFGRRTGVRSHPVSASADRIAHALDAPVVERDAEPTDTAPGGAFPRTPKAGR